MFVCLKYPVWIYDMGKFVCSIFLESTWRTFFDKLLKNLMPPKDTKAVAVDLVVGVHIGCTKCGGRKIKGESNSIRLNVTGFRQEMASTTDELHLALSIQ